MNQGRLTAGPTAQHITAHLATKKAQLPCSECSSLTYHSDSHPDSSNAVLFLIYVSSLHNGSNISPFKVSNHRKMPGFYYLNQSSIIRPCVVRLRRWYIQFIFCLESLYTLILKTCILNYDFLYPNLVYEATESKNKQVKQITETNFPLNNMFSNLCWLLVDYIVRI